MQHKIGNNYSEIIKQRKGRKDYPPVICLKNIKIDVKKLNDEISKINLTELDRNTSETQYRLNKLNGEKFIDNYENFIKEYSKITFHKMTDEAIDLSNKLPNVETYGPKERIKGMIDTGSRFYHPNYDERNYTIYTEHATGYIKEVLDMFEATTCRSAVVCLETGQKLSRHVDVGPEHIVRCHIPLVTNPEARMGFKVNNFWEEYHMPADGSVYAVNSGLEHYAFNFGSKRIHMRVCLMSQEDTINFKTINPVNIQLDESYLDHLNL